MFSKIWKFSLLTLLCYLLQATVSYHWAIADVAPNFALAIMAVVTVGLGRKYTFVMSLTVGYLLELMMPTLEWIQLVLYPVTALMGTLWFADKTERKLEEERTLGTHRPQWHPHIRTPLCAGLSTAIFEAAHLTYTYLNGVALDETHINRALISIAYTTVIAVVIQFPIRLWFGIYRLKKAR